uniref:Uncharacterized protein n=1 Tax=Panagrellus redivivus TaxID=6233 RepID=A0A7E4UPP7_PANRE
MLMVLRSAGLCPAEELAEARGAMMETAYRSRKSVISSKFERNGLLQRLTARVIGGGIRGSFGESDLVEVEHNARGVIAAALERANACMASGIEGDRSMEDEDDARESMANLNLVRKATWDGRGGIGGAAVHVDEKGIWHRSMKTNYNNTEA